MQAMPQNPSPSLSPSPSRAALPPPSADERGMLVGLVAKIVGFVVLGLILIGGAAYGIIKLAGDRGSENIARHVGCNEAEIFDAELAIARRTGFTRGFADNKGCVPVCVWQNDDDLLLEPDELRLHRELRDSVPIDATGVIAPDANYLFKTPNSIYGPAEAPVVLVSRTVAVPIYKVTAEIGKNRCRLLDFQGEPVPDSTAIELEATVIAPPATSTSSSPDSPPGNSTDSSTSSLLDSPTSRSTSSPPAEG